MTVAVLYVQRACAGGAITGLRLFHLRGSASWQVPQTKRATEEPLSTIASAADWTVEQLKNAPGPGHVTVVLDAQGSSCQWISTPSADDAVIKATVRDSLNAGDDEEGGAALSWLTDAAPGTDTSVQGLSDVALLEQPKASASARQRLALVSVTDLPVRVLLDELDKRDIEVRRVCTVWHAMALAWDPAAKENAQRGDSDERVVSSSDPVGAVVSIDSGGLLTWTWSQRGTLIAGGTMLLRKHEARIGDEPEQSASSGLRLAGSEGDEPDTRPTVNLIEVVRSDIGRLASDWLGWSVQLGLAPARIGVIGPACITCTGLEFDLPEMEGVAAVGSGLGKHWPGASVQATVDDDAAGRTLQRLMDMENGVGVASAPAAAVDPRLSLTELSGRPGAADRKLHRWAGLALLVAAGAVFVIGWRVGRTVGDVNAQADALVDEQAKQLKKVASMVPTAATSDTPALTLKSKRIEIERARADQKDEEPIIAEAQRVLLVLAEVPDVRLKTLQINSLGILSRFELSVPLEGDQGPTVKDMLTDRPSQANRIVKWDGKHIRTANAERRDWNMAGQFIDAPKRTAKPPAKPAGDTPGAEPKPPASPLLDTGPGAPPSPVDSAEPKPEAKPEPVAQPKPEAKPEPKTEPAPSEPKPAEPKKEGRS